MASSNTWSPSRPAANMFKQGDQVDLTSGEPPAKKPNTVAGGISLKIGGFQSNIRQPMANQIRTTVPKATAPPQRPGLQMVRTPRGMMPMCVAEKIFGPGLQGMGGTKYSSPGQFTGVVRPQNGNRPQMNGGGGQRPQMNGMRMNMMHQRPRANMRMNSIAMGGAAYRAPTFGGGIRPVRLPSHMGMVEKQQVPQPSADSNAKKAWPPGLTDYIQRSFSRCKNDTEKDEVEKYMKKMINETLKDGSAWAKNWQTEKLVIDILFPNASKAEELKTMAKKLGKNVNKKNTFGGLQMEFQLKKKARYESLPTKANSASPFSTMQLPDYLSGSKKNDRASRFGSENAKFVSQSFAKSTNFSMNLNSDYVDLQSFKITGTSTDIYKPYLRLTSAPDAHQVRTFETLKKTIIALKKKWNNGVKDVDAYRFVCDQFKSLRQDLTVQGIRNEFTVEVYEVHCRVALDAGDHEEFNQCKSQLVQLYHAGICSNHKADITAYELVYYMLTKNMVDMSKALCNLDDEMKSSPKVELALKLRKAWSRDNYSRFFKLYEQADIGMRALLDKFVNTQRRRSMGIMMKSYKPNIPVSKIQRSLGFKLDEDECREFLKEIGATVKNDMVCTKTPLCEKKETTKTAKPVHKYSKIRMSSK